MPIWTLLVRVGELPGYEDFAHADMLGSTDCLDPYLDEKDNGCFHVLMDRNTGVLVVRNTTNGIALMREWQAHIAAPRAGRAAS